MTGQKQKYALFSLWIYMVLGIADAKVTIALDSVLPGEGNVLCNSKAVVICTIEQYEIMTWTVNGKFVADCTYEVCRTSTNNGAKYGFSFDTNSGTFNITLDPVTFAENENIFQCDDGLDFTSQVLNVHVIPDNSLTRTKTSKPKLLTEIQVTTGCTFPGTITEFEWFVFEDGHTPEPYNLNGSIQSTTEHGCSRGQCGGKDVVKITNTLSIPEDPDGRNFYFQVLIKNPYATDVIIRADRPLKLNGPGISEGRIATPSLLTTILYVLEVILHFYAVL